MSPITLEQYFGRFSDKATTLQHVNADGLLRLVNALLIAAYDAGIRLPVNPATGSLISGAKYGGFRLRDCPEGAPDSSHKEARGIDIYDPVGYLDNWLTDDILKSYGLYREHPASTRGWCHLTDRAPRSKNRTFYP